MKFEIKNRWTGSAQFTAEIECDEDAPFSMKLGLAIRRALKARADLRSADLRSAVLSGADLSGADLRSADLRSAVLSGADLSGADLRGAVLSGADLRSADLSGADLRSAVLRSAVLSGAVLSGAVLRSADLRSADLRSAVLSGADLRSAVLSGAVLSGAVLRSAVLSGAVLSGAVLRSADLRQFKADFFYTLTRLSPSQREVEVPHLIRMLRAGRIDGATYGEASECACLVGTLAKGGKRPVSEFDDRNASNPAEQWFTMIRKGDMPGADTGGGFAAKVALEWATEWCALNGVAAPEDQPAAA